MPMTRASFWQLGIRLHEELKKVRDRPGGRNRDEGGQRTAQSATNGVFEKPRLEREARARQWHLFSRSECADYYACGSTAFKTPGKITSGLQPSQHPTARMDASIRDTLWPSVQRTETFQPRATPWEYVQSGGKRPVRAKGTLIPKELLIEFDLCLCGDRTDSEKMSGCCSILAIFSERLRSLCRILPWPWSRRRVGPFRPPGTLRPSVPEGLSTFPEASSTRCLQVFATSRERH